MDIFKHYWLKIAAYLANNHKKICKLPNINCFVGV